MQEFWKTIILIDNNFFWLLLGENQEGTFNSWNYVERIWWRCRIGFNISVEGKQLSSQTSAFKHMRIFFTPCIVTFMLCGRVVRLFKRTLRSLICSTVTFSEYISTIPYTGTFRKVEIKSLYECIICPIKFLYEFLLLFFVSGHQRWWIADIIEQFNRR